MATASHTPGPWKIGKYDKITTADGETLHLHGVAIPMAGYEGRDAEFKANALLIAAAPDMLKALELLEDIVEGLRCGRIWDRDNIEVVQAQLTAKYAIRLAKGQE